MVRDRISFVNIKMNFFSNDIMKGMMNMMS